jgi:predicted amino acid racemase
MLDRATLTVDLSKIAENTRRVIAALSGVEIVGVTKSTCGTPEVARAMLHGGVRALGESRLENIARLREAGVDAPVWLLRAPTPRLAEETVRLVDVSAISEFDIAVSLDAAAARAGLTHRVIAMVDVGDLREGMMPYELSSFAERVSRLGHVEIVGVGASLTCYGAIVPDERNLGELASCAARLQHQLGRPMIVSGGSSTSIAPLLEGRAPAAVDNLRVGEAILLGVDPATRLPIPGLDLSVDAVRLAAPVIECKVKPSLPIGTSAQDAFGQTPVFEDRGERTRAVCALGRQDAPAEGLRPIDPRIKVLGASSDHLVLDVHNLPVRPRVGEAIEFAPGYSAVLHLFTSPYVGKEFVNAP